jgi:hypothetical protein
MNLALPEAESVNELLPDAGVLNRVMVLVAATSGAAESLCIALKKTPELEAALQKTLNPGFICLGKFITNTPVADRVIEVTLFALVRTGGAPGVNDPPATIWLASGLSG